MSIINSKKSNTIAETDVVEVLNARGNKAKFVPVSALRASLDTVPTGTPVNAVAASGTVIFSGTPVADETVTIGSDVYTFKATRSLAFEVTINANNTTQGDNLVTAITADATGDYAGVNAAGTVTITSGTKGVVGNSIALATDATGTAVSAATLEGGVDGTVGDANETRTDSSYLYVAIAANTTSDTNWRRISLGTVY